MANETWNWNELKENNSYTCEICPEYNENLKEAGNDISTCYKQSTKVVHKKNPACNWFYDKIKKVKRDEK